MTRRRAHTTSPLLRRQPFEAREYDRARAGAGARIEGPAVIREGLSTTFILPRPERRVGRFGEITIRVEKRP